MRASGLVTLDRDVPLDFGVDDLVKRAPDKEELARLFTDLEFKALLSELDIEHPASAPAKHDGEIEFACRADLAGELGMYVAEGAGSALTQGETTYVCFESELYLDPLKNTEAHITMHDAKQAFVSAIRQGIDIRAGIDDVMLGAYCIDAASGSVPLEDLAKMYLDKHVLRLKDLTGSGRSFREFCDIDRNDLAGCMAGYASVLVPLKGKISERMEKVGVDKIYADIEIPLTRVLASMEAGGVLIDLNGLQKISKEITGFLDDMEGRIYGMAGEKFNINSPKQLGEILFERLKLPVGKKTKTGYSTDSKVLESLAFRHDLPALILEYRMYAKLKNTYVDALPHDDRSRGRAGSTPGSTRPVTATGRISSSEPNLQNIPIRSEMGRRIREAFIAPAGLYDPERRLFPDRAPHPGPHHR